MQAQVLRRVVRGLYGVILRLAIGSNHEQAVPLHSWRLEPRTAYVGRSEIGKCHDGIYGLRNCLQGNRLIDFANLRLTDSCATSCGQIHWKSSGKRRHKIFSSTTMYADAPTSSPIPQPAASSKRTTSCLSSARMKPRMLGTECTERQGPQASQVS